METQLLNQKELVKGLTKTYNYAYDKSPLVLR